MDYRESELQTSMYVTAAGVTLIDLNIADPISRITVLCMPRGSSWPVLGHPAQCFTGIDVVNGSDVLFGMNGVQADALDYYDNKRLSYRDMTYLQGANAIVAIHLNFGRFLFDPVLGLDPTQFKNLQLRLTHNYLAGGCTTDRLYFRVFADLFDEKRPDFIGFLMSKEIEAVTVTQLGNSYVDLPTDFPIRKIMLESRCDDDGPVDQFEYLKLAEDHDKRILYDIDTYDLIRSYQGLYPIVSENVIFGGATSSREVDVTPGHCIRGTVSGATTFATYGGFTPRNGCEGQCILHQNDQGQISVLGWCPHNAVPLLTGNQDEIESWWKTEGIGSKRLQMRHGTGALTTQTVGVITQQFRRY